MADVRPSDRGKSAKRADGETSATGPTDPYLWLEDAGTAQTARWLAQRQQEFCTHATTWPLRPWLATEIHRLVAQDHFSMPQPRGQTTFAAHRPADAEHPRLTARSGHGLRVVFDPMHLDPTGRTTLDAWEAAPCGRLVAVQTSQDGTEHGQLHVLDTTTGLPVEKPVVGIRYSHVAWLSPPVAGGGQQAFYYVRRDNDSGQRGVWLHRVQDGSNGNSCPDILIHPCTDSAGVPGVRLERDRWLLVTESHGTGHREDLWIADLTAAGSPAEAPLLRAVHVGTDVVSQPRLGPDGWLYLRTSLAAPRRRICRVNPAAPAPANWHEVVAEDDRTPQDALAVLTTESGGCELLIARTWLGMSTLWAHDPEDGRRLRQLPLPGEGMITHLETLADTAATPPHRSEAIETLWLAFSGVTTPQQTFRYVRPTSRWQPWPTQLPHAKHTKIRRQVQWFRSADGTDVPVTVLSARPFDTTRPTILHAYGAYGRPRQFGFSATVLAWLRAGGQYAVAHVRGGGDLGRQWHLDGARRAKPVAVADLLAAADGLTAAGYCSRDSLCLSGGSAGGLLVLAAMARRPECCAVVLASAPLADMLRFERLGLGALWTREFGSATDLGDRAVLASYSPYHRVLSDTANRSYPAVLLTGFHGDTRTGAAHARKMCAALQQVCTETSPALLRYEYGVGHGPRALSRAVDLAADAHAFVAAWTGLTPLSPVGSDTNTLGGVQLMDSKEPTEISVEVEDLPEVTSRDTTAGGDTDGKDSSSDFI